MNFLKIFDITKYEMKCGSQPDMDPIKRKEAINRIHRNFDILAKWHIIYDYHYNYNYIADKIDLSFKCSNLFKKFVFGCLVKYKL